MRTLRHVLHALGGIFLEATVLCFIWLAMATIFYLFFAWRIFR